MNGLDDLLNQEEPEEKNVIKRNNLNSLRITKYAFEKAYAYARLACDIAKESIECGGYLIAPKGAKDRIATDSFLAKNQDVSAGLFTIKAEDVIKAGREIDEIGYKVLGWWHSHGDLETFFSSIDDGGQMTVLNEISAINYITRRERKNIDNLIVQDKGGRIVMFDKSSPERKYEIEFNGNPAELSIANLKLQLEKKIGFAYGLVVNVMGSKREPYAEIATREMCGFCRNSKDTSVPVNIKLYENGEFVIDDDSLRKEIKERVKMRSRFIRFRKRRYEDLQTPLSAETLEKCGPVYLADFDNFAETDDFFNDKEIGGEDAGQRQI